MLTTYLISTYRGNEEALGRLLRSMEYISPERKIVVCGGCTNAGYCARTSAQLGVRYFRATHNSFDFTALIEGLSGEFELPARVFTLHDTMELTDRADELINAVDTSRDAVAAFFGQCMLVSFSREYLLARADDILSWRDCSKDAAIAAEVRLWADCATAALYPGYGCQVTGRVPIDRAERLREFYPGVGVVKWKAHWGPHAPRLFEPADTRRKLILRSHLSPGDIVTMTAAVRDLHAAYPGEFATDVRTYCPALWEHNPHITPIADGEGEEIAMEYPLIHTSNQRAYHVIHGYRMFLEEKLGKPIPAREFRGDIHLSNEEKGWLNQVEEQRGVGTRFWIVAAGGKFDYTAKWWDSKRYQEVVDYFAGRILFVQVGELQHHHPPLRGVLDLRGKTNLRQLVRLVYHSDGVVCGVTSLMHLAAAVPTKTGWMRPCVVVAGGREPSHWEAYPGHRYLHTIGALECCANGGCWRSRIRPLGDGDEKDGSLCERPVQVRREVWIPKCLEMIEARDVIRAVEQSIPVHTPATQAPPVVRPSGEVPRNVVTFGFGKTNGKVRLVNSCSAQSKREWGPLLWRELHLRPAVCDLATEEKWLREDWLLRVPCSECRTHFRKILEKLPPDLRTREDYFVWSVAAHNAVNEIKGAPALPLDQARELYPPQ